MKGFTEQLGVKCSHCHVLDEYDKDDNEHKIVARQMIRLVQFMRDNTLEYFKEGTKTNQIGCWTCHRGEAEIDGSSAGLPRTALSRKRRRPDGLHSGQLRTH